MSSLQTQVDVSTSSEQRGSNDSNNDGSSSLRSPPPPPNPAADPCLLDLPSPDNTLSSPRLAAQHDDIFKVPPLAALKLLSAGIEALVIITGDIPPTPPPSSPTVPNMRGMQAEKENIVRSHSEKNLARLRLQAQQQSFSSSAGSARSSSQDPAGSHSNSTLGTMAIRTPTPQPIDGVHLRTPNPTPEPKPDEQPQPPREPYIVIGENSQPLNLQHSAITRKFYSKQPPPISITDYLLRIHHFCPMSTAVYLATSLYIHRLAVAERAIAVTRRNAHRLLLAGLRVAMKALEDLSYPHSKVAKVGGVSEAELARLEINFCFLAGFELVVGEEALRNQWEMLRRGRGSWSVMDESGRGFQGLRLERKPRGG